MGVKGRFGCSVLHYACEGGNVGLVQTLMQNHCMEINLRDDNDNTPLHVGASLSKGKLALCLINEFGSDPNMKGDVGRSVLHSACRGGNDGNPLEGQESNFTTVHYRLLPIFAIWMDTTVYTGIGHVFYKRIPTAKPLHYG